MTRVAQLLAKTNQFNLTTRRHTAADVAALLDKGAVALWARVKDRFGDNGLVGAAIAAPEADGRWVIDTFLLSCRVIGRRVETALLSALSEEVRGRGARALLGEYLPTAKNKPAADFYPKHGFTAEGERWARTEPVPPPVLLKIERQR
jgi:FkbH-like protein